MVQTSSTIPGSAIRGVSSGVIFMAFFSMLWASIGVGGLQGWGAIWPTVVVVLIGIGLFASAISLIIASRRVSNESDEMGDKRHWKRRNIWFIIVFATEMILIFAASYICNVVLNRFDLFFPIMALIVGVHFFPLAPLFEIKAYHLVGALLCLLGLLALFVIPAQAQIGASVVNPQWMVLGFGAALILWCVGIGLTVLGRKWLKLSSATPMVSTDTSL